MSSDTPPTTPAASKKVKLSKPVTIGDKTIDEVEIDVDQITGADIMMCIREAAAINGVVVSYAIDPEVHLQMACKLGGIDRAVVMRLPGRDFNRLIAPVRSFFLESD